MESEAAADADRQLDFHPGMAMRWEITRSTEDSSGELRESLELARSGNAGAAHSRASRKRGELRGNRGVPGRLQRGGVDDVGGGRHGDSSGGFSHTLRNASDEPAETVTRIRPAGRSEAFFRQMNGLIHAGKIKRLPPKEPRSAIYAAMLFDRYPDVICVTGPLSGVFKTLALVGKTLRCEL